MAEENAIKRVMPHSIEAEQSVIGAMLMDAEAIEIASETLKEEDFYARQYGVLFSAILQMHQKGEAVDPVTLQTRLREKNLPPEIYSGTMILDLIDQVPTSANIKSYAGIVAEKSLLRKMIRANEEIAGACYNQKDELEEIMNQAEKKIFEISFSTRSRRSNMPAISKATSQDCPPDLRIWTTGPQDSRIRI